MAKTTPSPSPAPPARPPIPERYQDAAAVLCILLTLLVFFARSLGSASTLQASDAISFNSFVPFLHAEEKAGEFPLWIPNIFSGMPAYGSLLVSGNRWFDLTVFAYMQVERVVKALSGNPDVFRIIFEYWVLGLGMYLYMRSRRMRRGVALFSALAVVYSAYIIVLVMIGHNTKVWAIMCAPYLLLSIDKLLERFRWRYVAVLAIATHLCIESTHVQMTFNIFFGLGLYLLYHLVVALVKRTGSLPALKAIAAFVVCAGLGAGMAADRYLSVQEYNAYSIRGTGPLVQANGDHATEGGGLDYDYATNWSFSPEEVLTFLVPGYYGNGVVPFPYQGRTVYAHAYWGQMPFTDLPNYMGIVVLILAMYGLATNVRERWVQGLTIMALIGLFVSFGKNFSPLYDLMFYGVPFFNKFRAPSQMLILVQLAIPILAGLGLQTFVAQAKAMDAQRRRRLLWYGAGVLAVYLLIYLSGLTPKESYVAAVEESHKSELPGDYVYRLAMGDWERCAAFAVLFFGGALAFLRGWLRPGWLMIGVTGLTLLDLLWVDARRMEIVPHQQATADFQRTDIVDFLQRDSSLFRIYDVTEGPNIPVYWNLQHIVGYHAAKMRSYQDLLDIAGVGTAGVTPEFVNAATRAHANTGGPIANPLVWNLLNVKYIVSPLPPGPGYPVVFTSKSEKAAVYENPGMLPRAFFVKECRTATLLGTYTAMRDGSFDPRAAAFVEHDAPAIDAADSTATASVTGYGPQDVTIRAHASGRNLLVCGEVYYAPGWKAYVDGAEVPVLRVDALLRGVVVPAGDHTVEFRFHSAAFERGKTIALILNIVVLAFLGVTLVARWRGGNAGA